MTTGFRSLLAASAAAALLAAPAARAHDEDGRWVPPPAYAPPAYAPPAYRPSALPCPPVAPLPEPMTSSAGWGPRWQGPYQELRAEYDRLEQARSGFYSYWRGNPWAQRRFEGWYQARRAELDRRSEWLSQRAAWSRWPGRAFAEARHHSAWRERDDD